MENFYPYVFKKDLNEAKDISLNNLTQLIEYLTEIDPLQFNMDRFYTAECETAACIAGWEAIRVGTGWKRGKPITNAFVIALIDNYNFFPSAIAKNSLGLSHDLAYWLFYGYFDKDVKAKGKSPVYITLGEALYALNWLKEQAQLAQQEI